MTTEKRNLKPIWLKALQEIFVDAYAKGSKTVTVTALDLEHRAKERGAVPSTCNAMRSIMDPTDKIIYAPPKGNSTTFSVQYSLPKAIPIEAYESKKTIRSNSVYEHLIVFEKSETLEACLNKCEKEYRLNDQGRESYKPTVSFTGDRFSDEFIGKVYDLLVKWDMNSRGAKLQDKNKFIASLKENKSILKRLDNTSILEIEKPVVMATLKELFDNLDLVKTNTKIVTFAKALHIFFPNLIVPIDRKYTCAFLHIYFDNANKEKKFKNQWDAFQKIEITFSRFAKNSHLSKYINQKGDWNINIPKIMDNMIIGHNMLHKTSPQ